MGRALGAATERGELTATGESSRCGEAVPPSAKVFRCPLRWLALTGTVIVGMAIPATVARAHDDPGGDPSGDPNAGRMVARQHCARCHVIGDFNPYGGIGSTPSFQLLARRSDWLERFQTFYERRPHPVFVRVPDVPRWTKLPGIPGGFL